MDNVMSDHAPLLAAMQWSGPTTYQETDAAGDATGPMVDGRFVWVRDRTLQKMYALPVTYTIRDGEKSELGNS